MFYHKADSLLLRYSVLKYEFVSRFVCVQDMLKEKLTVKESVPLFCLKIQKNTGLLIFNSLKQKKLIFNFSVNRN